MKLGYSDTARVDFDTAASAAIELLNVQPRNRHGQRIPLNASRIADAIWPGHEMTAQGAGGAASRILKRLEKRNRVMWTVTNGKWGWVLR